MENKRPRSILNLASCGSDPPLLTNSAQSSQDRPSTIPMGNPLWPSVTQCQAPRYALCLRSGLPNLPLPPISLLIQEAQGMKPLSERSSKSSKINQFDLQFASMVLDL